MNVVFSPRQGMFAAGSIYEKDQSRLAERFPTDVRASATGFC